MGVCSSNAASKEAAQAAPVKVIQVKVRDPAASTPPRPLQNATSSGSLNSATTEEDALKQSSPADGSAEQKPRLANSGSSSLQPPTSTVRGADTTLIAHHHASSSSLPSMSPENQSSTGAQRQLLHASSEESSRQLSVPMPTSASSSSLAASGSGSGSPNPPMTLTPHTSNASTGPTSLVGRGLQGGAPMGSYHSSRSQSPAPQHGAGAGYCNEEAYPAPARSPSHTAVGFHRPPSMSPVSTSQTSLTVPPLPVRARQPKPIREYESRSVSGVVSTTDVHGAFSSLHAQADRMQMQMQHNSEKSSRSSRRIGGAEHSPVKQLSISANDMHAYESGGVIPRRGESSTLRSPWNGNQRDAQISPSQSPNHLLHPTQGENDEPVTRTRAASMSAAVTSAATSAMPSAPHTPQQDHSPVMHAVMSSMSSVPPLSSASSDAHHMDSSAATSSSSILALPTAVPSLSHSKTVPANLAALRSEPAMNAHHRQGSDSHLQSASAQPPAFTCTRSVEFGLTADGYAHINQYIIEVSEKKRERMQAKERRMAEREERVRRMLEINEAEASTAAAANEVPSTNFTSIAVDDSEGEEEEDDDDDDEDDGSILGRGAYGLVKKVFNSQDNRFYAMKIMSRQMLLRGRGFGRAEDAIASVKREIAIMKKLDHPNIVRLHEVMCDSEKDKVYMIMQLAEMGPVMKVDLEDGEVETSPGQWNIVAPPLSVDRARSIFRDVLSGLDYLHHQKVIHRDIKPENILMSAEGRAMIADFGVSTLCESDEGLISSTAGTAAFMSPEMVKSGAKSKAFGGAQTDVWSLGVSLFYMVYGRLPWYAKSLPEIYRMIVEQPLEFPQEKQFEHIPVQVKHLINGMLDKSPATRITIAQMQQCPWVSDSGSWCPYRALAQTAGLEAAQFKSKPLIADQLCSGDIAAAISSGAKPLLVGAQGQAMSEKEQSTLVARVRARLSKWRREMKKQCDAKKDANRKKKMQAHFIHVAKLPIAGHGSSNSLSSQQMVEVN